MKDSIIQHLESITFEVIIYHCMSSAIIENAIQKAVISKIHSCGDVEQRL